MDYKPDRSAQEAKRTELIEDVAASLDTRDVHLAPRIVDAFCQLSPPLDPPTVMHVRSYHTHVRTINAPADGYRGGASRKPGNLLLNWRKLFGEFGDIALNTAGVIAAPPLIPFAALSLWNKLWSHATIPLSREHAAALVAMWHRRDERDRVLRPVAHEETNTRFTVFKWPLLDLPAFDALLTELEAIKCIERRENDSIWLREWVSTSYT